MDVFLDCETAPTTEQWFIDEIEIQPPNNYKKPESIQKWLDENKEAERQKVIDKTAVDTSMARIICICYAIDDEPAQTLTIEHFSEGEILLAFFSRLPGRLDTGGLPPINLIGHNILAFDIPLIFHRSIIWNINPASAFHMHYKPWGGSDYHNCFDTMIEWCGTRDRISQHNLARLLGIETQDTDGSQVPQLYADGKIEEIARKCAFDVEQNRKIYRRITGR